MLFPLPRMQRYLPWLCYAALLVGGGGGIASAQIDYRLTAGLSSIANDGTQAANDPTSKTDVSGALRGGIELGYLGRFATSRLSYGIMAVKWARNTQSSGLTHTLRLSSDMEVTPATRVGLSAGAMLTQLSLADTVSAASLPTTGPQPTGPQSTSSPSSSPQQIGPQPAASQDVLTLDAREAVSWQPSGQWRLDQGLMGSAYRPLSSGSGSIDNKVFALDLGLAKQWQRDTAGLRGRASIMMASGSASGGTEGSETIRYTELAEASLVWGHQWGAEIAQEIIGGAVVVRADQARVSPIAAAGLTWQRPGFMLAGRVAQTSDASVTVGASYQRRLASLTLGVPVNRLETVRLMALASYERATPTGTSDTVGGAINVFAAQAGLGWQPGDTFAYGLAYTFRDQWAADSGDASSSPLAFRRQTLMLTISASYGGIL